MTPSSVHCVNCFPYADFVGLCGYKHRQDHHCARSCTGYVNVILAFSCPVLWNSLLQMGIMLSTMEAEYLVLSMACKDLLPLVALIHELGAAVGLDNDFISNIHCKVNEDNVGALILGPSSTICFMDPAQHITLVKIDTKNHLDSLFTITTGFTYASFSHLRHLLMGW